MNTLQLGSIPITIEYDEQIANRLELIFGGWGSFHKKSDTFQSSGLNIFMRLKLLERLPQDPSHPPTYIETLGIKSDPRDSVAIYEYPDELTFHFGTGALVRLHQSGKPKDESYFIQAAITPRLLRSGQLEDVIFTSLAPLLRRTGTFLTHAFAVTHGQSATLFVGPSGSGKTTSGLLLVSAGWGYLANDVTMLRLQSSQVISLPTPGGIGISDKTVEIIPGLKKIWKSNDKTSTIERLYFPANQVVSGWAEHSPVSRICFPEIALSDECYFKPIGKAVALAMLMENSIDRWDQEYLSQHISLLETMCQQAECFKLFLGRNVNHLPELFAN
jgi:hypothetical protein